LSKARLLTRKQLAAELECDPRTIAKWQEDGMPVAARGRGGRASRYDLAVCRAWKDARAKAAAKSGLGDLAFERAQREREQAKLLRQKFLANSRELLPAAEVEKQWLATAAAVRGALLAIPVTEADRIHRTALLDGVAGVEAALAEIIDRALSELSTRDDRAGNAA
jgi:phage terminase Nu1 subunit (DNA packaging protein)